MLEKLKQEVYKANLELPERGLIKYTWEMSVDLTLKHNCLS